MIFDYLLTVFLTFPAIFAVIKTKEGAKIESHLATAFVLGVFALILSFLGLFESMFATAFTGTLSITTPTVFGIQLPTGLEFFGPFLNLITVFIAYFVSAIIAMAYFGFEKGFSRYLR
ncbi:MAG: hypothetical protein ACTSWZ_07805 [Candidatus Heimdallarchaeaceae archaeon]